MTRKEALRILAKHAASDIKGVGQGYRTSPTNAEREDAEAAYRILFKMLHGRWPDYGEGPDFKS